MKVSVIVPLYNKVATVQRTLDSILGQTFTDFELLVVDDGSTDGSGEIVARCQDARLRLISQKNAGPGAARNRALAEARGEYVTSLDADDEWLPAYLERALSLFSEHGPEVAAVTVGYLEYPSGASREPLWRERGLREGVYHLTPDFSPQAAVYLLAYMNPWSTVAKVETVRRLGGFYGKTRCLYGEDAYLWLKVLLNETVAISFEPLVKFHTEASGLSRNLRGARPIEPHLLDPDGLREDCPPALQGLLADILAIRALKTAAMLGYWGQWREGRALLRRFLTPAARRRPLYYAAQVATTPAGPLLGSAHRLATHFAR